MKNLFMVFDSITKVTFQMLVLTRFLFSFVFVFVFVVVVFRLKMPLKASCLMLFIVRLPSDSSVQAKKTKKQKTVLISFQCF